MSEPRFLNDPGVQEWAAIAAPVFASQGWQWRGAVPGQQEIAANIARLLRDVGPDTLSVSSGRIRLDVSRREDGADTIEICLELGVIYDDELGRC